MPIAINFIKTGQEIKEAIGNRISQLQERLERRNDVLIGFMKNDKKLRSYLVRNSEGSHSRHVLFSKDDISSEEKEEVNQLCRRIYEIEQELHRLQLIKTHLSDEQQFELPFEDLVAYGFDLDLELESE